MRPLQASLLIIALWAVLFLPGLGDTELKGEEGRRILPAREMLRRDDFVLPYSEGRPYHRKPPGINWAIAGVFKVTGVQNEWTARTPSVLAVLALALTGVWAGFRMGGSKMGLALGIALLVNGGMLEKARLAEIESLYVSLAGMGVLAWAVHWGTRSSPWKIWLSTIIPFAMANLVKGPVYLLFFYPIVLLVHRRTRTWRELMHPAHIISLVLALLPMILWGILVKQQLADSPPLAMLDDNGTEVVGRTPGEVWWQQIYGRLSFASINPGDWLQLPFRVLLLLAPWPILALVLGRNRSTPAPAEEPRLVALRHSLAWGLLFSILIFCLLPATRARYLMPALGPCTLWAVLSIFSAPENSRRLLGWNRLVLGVLILASLTALISPWFLLASAWQAFIINSAAVVIAWLLGRKFSQLEAPLRSFALTALPFVVLSISLATTVLPKARFHENIRPTATAILAAAPLPGSIVALHPGPQPFLFYLGTRCVEAVKISDFPEDTAYVLIQRKLWESTSQTMTKLRERGFDTLITIVRDQRADDDSGKEYLLIGRDPASLPEGSKVSPSQVPDR